MKCSQKECREIAAWTYVWPGNEGRSWACATHLVRAVEIAATIGCKVGDLRRATIGEMVTGNERAEGT